MVLNKNPSNYFAEVRSIGMFSESFSASATYTTVQKSRTVPLRTF